MLLSRLLCVNLALVCVAPLSGAAPETSFSHKRHANFKMRCANCHALSDSSGRMDFPRAGICASCHGKLKEARSLDFAKLAWTSAPRIPDFVLFGHASHLKASLDCAACHGSVWETDIPGPPAALHMRACIACHKQYHAPTDCHVCHELGQ
jgi:hypothetical protein